MSDKDSFGLIDLLIYGFLYVFLVGIIRAPIIAGISLITEWLFDFNLYDSQIGKIAPFVLSLIIIIYILGTRHHEQEKREEQYKKDRDQEIIDKYEY